MAEDQRGEKEIALETRAVDADRLFSPSAARNRDVIRDAFLSAMPNAGRILEVGAGTGEHAVHIAAKLPKAAWRPGDPDADSRRSIAAWTAALGLTNVAAPHAVDVSAATWSVEADAPFAGVVSINMIHIAPFAAAQGLFAGAGRVLTPGGKLFLYGPFARNGVHTAPSNAEFDFSLKSRDPRWGVRDLELELLPLADKAGLAFERDIPMPANNYSLIFQKA